MPSLVGRCCFFGGGLWLLWVLLAGAGAGAARAAEWVPGQVLVKYREEGAGGARRLNAGRGWPLPAGARRLKAVSPGGWALLELPPGMTVRRAVDWLRVQAGVEAAEPNYRYRAHRVPDDPYFDRLYGMERIGGPVAWERTQGEAEVVVGVFDTGMDLTHPDLAANLWTNAGEVAGNGRDDDGNGWVDDVHGIDVVDGDGDPADDSGHGTHVAGTIGAVGGNGLGVAGVAWKARLMLVRVLAADGSATTVELVGAFEYAARMRRGGVNLRVINCSWGGGYPSQALKESMEAAAAEGILLVCSAGNDHADTDALPTFPAGYDIPDVISVGASTSCDDPSSFSNYGRLTVDLAAPGSGILSTYRGGERYGVLSGTSMAAPHVSGAAALLFSLRPRATPAEVRAWILGTVDVIPSWEGRSLTGGRLNVARAVDEAAANRGAGSKPTGSSGTPSGRVRAVSRAADGRWGNGRSFQPALSGDGRWVAFVSAATNLVTGDDEGFLDVFLADRQSGTVQRVSQTPAGAGGTGDSESPVVSADGRFVVFVSMAGNLVPSDVNGTKDVFLWDRQTRQLELISVRSDGRASANGLSEVPAVNRDGSLVVFASDATDLVAGDGNRARDIFVRDRSRRRTERVNVGPGGVEAADWSDAPTLSGDGRWVAFHSGAANLVAGDTNQKWDVFLRDRTTGVTEIVGGAGNGDDDSLYPLLSGDGNWVVFSSAAASLAGGPTGGVLVICLHDRVSKRVIRVGEPAAGGVPKADAYAFGISADGRMVTFTSDDPGLWPGGELGFFRSYLHDRLRGVFAPVAVSDAGYPAEDSFYYAPISADGRTVAFVSNAFGLVPGDGNAVADVFVVDRSEALGDLGVRLAGMGEFEGAGVIHAGRPQRVGTRLGAGETVDFEVQLGNAGPARSYFWSGQGGGDGWKVQARRVTPGGDEDITGAWTGSGWKTPELPAGSNLVIRVSVSRSGGDRVSPMFSSRIEVRPTQDGAVMDAVSLVVFADWAPPGWTLASRGQAGYPAARAAEGGSLSGDGARLVFSSESDHLVPGGDINLESDVFLVERGSGAVSRLSDAPSGAQGNGESRDPSISADGRRVAFQSRADNLVSGDSNEVEDVFVKDLASGKITRASVSSAGVEGRRGSEGAVLAGGGRHVMFTSVAGNLVEGDANGARDVFVRDLEAGVTECVSRSGQGAFGDGDSLGEAISGDGRFVVFTSYAANLGPADLNRTADVYLWDRETRTMELISAGPVGQAGNGASGGASVSDDGRWVGFHSYATDLVVGGGEGYQRQSYLLDRREHRLRRVGELVGALPDGLEVRSSRVSPDGRWLGLAAAGGCGAGPAFAQVLVYDLVAGRVDPVSATLSEGWGNGHSFPLGFAAEGRFLAFGSMASSLVGEFHYPAQQIYWADLSRPAVDALVRGGLAGGWRAEGVGTSADRPAAVVLAERTDSGAVARFGLRVVNQGNTTDRFRLRAEVPSEVGVRVDWPGGAGADVGSPDGARAWMTPSLRPGESLDLTLTVRFATVSGSDWDLQVRVESTADTARRDWIRVTTTRDTDNDGMPDAWELRYFGGLGVAGVGTDGDGDGATDLVEWLTRTDPTRPGDALRLGIGLGVGEGRLRLTWRGKAGHRYWVERSSSPEGGFTAVMAQPVEGEEGDVAWEGVSSEGGAGVFYRLRVELP